MKYKEAQDLSISGVAVLGSRAMQDVIWPQCSDRPYLWVTNGYKPMDPETLRDRDGWSPLHVLGTPAQKSPDAG